jgi:hypothetical protein
LSTAAIRLPSYGFYAWLCRLFDQCATPRRLAIGYFCLASLAVLAMDLIVPPLSAPDEFNHLFRAAMISSGRILTRPGPDRLIGGEVDSALVGLLGIMGPVAGTAAPTPPDRADEAQHVLWAKTPIFVEIPNTGQYGPVLYLPQAIGLAIGRRTGLSVIQSYDLARLLTAFTALGIAALAVATAGRGALLVAVVLSTPMFLFLVVSLSQDGMLIAVSALFGALAVRGRTAAPGRWGWVAWVCALLMAMARPTYAPLAVLLVNRRRGRPLFQWLSAPDGPLAPLLLGSIVLLWLFADGVLVQPSFARFPGVDQSAQLAGLLRDPFSVVRVAAGTLDHDDEGLVISRGIIGVLGTLNILLSSWAYSLGWQAIGLAALGGLLQRSGQSLSRPLFAVLIFLFSIGAIYGAMYLTWTVVGSGFVTGVQGRYLLPQMAAMPLLIPGIVPARWGSARGPALDRMAAIIGLIAWGLMILVSLHAIHIVNTVYRGVSLGPWY